MSTADLICLVADKDMEQLITGLLSRTRSLETDVFEVDIFIHPQRDPGCVNEAQSFLRPFLQQYAYALVLFDHQGSGRESVAPDALEHDLEQRLAANGWDDRARVIVLRPELEIWMWSNSPHVDRILGWAERSPALREWLRTKGLLEPEAIKPRDPKEAMEQALREVHKPRSAALYRQIAERVSFKGCIDPSFNRLRSILQAWFPPESGDF